MTDVFVLRFAMMEEKVVISSVLRAFTLSCATRPEDIPLLAEVILRPKHGIRVSLARRG